MPLLLDLFSGAGGAAMGYHRAGFRVIGVDIRPQPRYPFEFHQMDVMEALGLDLSNVDVIHASPPCHRWSVASSGFGWNLPDLIEPTRAALRNWGGPYLIENVEAAPLVAPTVLCGSMFGLGVIRHRGFESNCPLIAADHGVHGRIGDGRTFTVAGHHGSKGSGRRDGGTLAEWSEAMGIDWMNGRELAQAIPPAYTEHLGRQVLSCLS
jgi:DNA (cytosine-5)-methyltransferase 1